MYGSLPITIFLLTSQIMSDPVRKILSDFPHEVRCLAFSPDQKMLATGTRPSEGGKDAITLWDVATGKELCRLGEGHRLGCSSLAFSPDGKTLITNGGPGQTLQLWDVLTRKVRLSIKVGEGVGGSLVVSPDSKTFATSDYGPPVRLFDMATGEEKQALEGSFQALCIVFSPDGKLVAASGYGGSVALWDLTTGKQRGVLKKHTRTVNSLGFSPDSKTLYSLGTDSLLVLWDTSTGGERKAIELKKGRLRYAALSPDGKTLAVLGGNILRLFDLTQEQFWPELEWQYQKGIQFCLSFSPDGRQIATGSGGSPATNSVYLYEIPQRMRTVPK